MAKKQSAKATGIRAVQIASENATTQWSLCGPHAHTQGGERWQLWELIKGHKVQHDEKIHKDTRVLAEALRPIVERGLAGSTSLNRSHHEQLRGFLLSMEKFYMLAEYRLWRQVDPPSDDELASILRIAPPPDLSVLVAEISEHVAAEESLPHALRLRVLQWREMFRERTPSAALILDPFRKAPGYPTTDASLLGCLRLALAMLPMYFERDSTIWPPKDPSQTSDVLARAGVICDRSPSTLLASTKPAAVLSGAIGTVIERRRLDDSLHRPEEFQLLKHLYPFLRLMAKESWAQTLNLGEPSWEFPNVQSECGSAGPLATELIQLLRQHSQWWANFSVGLSSPGASNDRGPSVDARRRGGSHLMVADDNSPNGSNTSANSQADEKPESKAHSLLQRQILAALRGKALRLKELEKLAGCRRDKLYRKKEGGGLSGLMSSGLIRNDRRRGYYRPDSPPLQSPPRA